MKSSADFHWYDYSVGIVNGNFVGKLKPHGETNGDGTYITIRDGEYYPNGPGGWYYEVGIQLPRGIDERDIFDLNPAEAGRHLEPVGEYDRLGFLRPNEFVAFHFGGQLGGCMSFDATSSNGKLEIVSMSQELVTFKLQLHADIPDSSDIDINRQFTVRRE